MNHINILYPVFTLAAWTGIVLLLIPFQRVRAGLQGHVTPNDFRYGESARVPPHVTIPNRNYMNLLELPLLFYVACLMLYAGGKASSSALIATAWVYVGLRIGHSVVHLSYNNVLHRLGLFATSNLVLIVYWVLTFLHVTAPPQ